MLWPTDIRCPECGGAVLDREGLLVCAAFDPPCAANHLWPALALVAAGISQFVRRCEVSVLTDVLYAQISMPEHMMTEESDATARAAVARLAELAMEEWP